MSRKEKISNIIHNTIMILVGLLLIYVLYSYAKAEDKRTVFFFGYKPAIIVSGSMEPVIKTDSLIIVKQSRFEDIHIGDVEMFKYQDKIITHQVIEKKHDTLHTKGVNNHSADPFLVNRDMSLGKVVFVWNGVAPVIQYFMHPVNLILLIILIILIFVFYELLKKVIRTRKNAPE